MVILTQDEASFYDLDKSSSIYANEDGTVYLANYTGEIIYPIGKYKNEERAKEVVKEIFALYDVQSRYMMPVIWGYYE